MVRLHPRLRLPSEIFFKSHQLASIQHSLAAARRRQRQTGLHLQSKAPQTASQLPARARTRKRSQQLSKIRNPRQRQSPPLVLQLLLPKQRHQARTQQHLPNQRLTRRPLRALQSSRLRPSEPLVATHHHSQTQATPLQKTERVL